MTNAPAVVRNIFSTRGRDQAEAALKGINEVVLKAKRKQFDAYQQWVVKVWGVFWEAHGFVTES